MTVRQPERPEAKDHQSLAFWAADCAERVLPLFEDILPEDDRPRKAIEAARAWARGELPMTKARQAAFAAHAAARSTNIEPARLAARASGHAAATAHVAGHARHAANYAFKALSATFYPNHNGDTISEELDWQYNHLPEHLRSLVYPAANREF
jgi:hypothetical protein